MVVVDSIFVTSGRSNRLDSSKKIVLDQHAEGVVHRLARDRANVRLREFGHLVRGCVGLFGDCAQYGDALGGRLNTAVSKLVKRTDTHRELL